MPGARAALLLVLVAAPAGAEAPAAAVPDASLRAVKGRWVTVETSSGSLSGTLVEFSDEEVVLLPADGVAESVLRSTVKRLRVRVEEPPPPRRALGTAPLRVPIVDRPAPRRVAEAPARGGDWRVGRSQAITGMVLTTLSVPGFVLGGIFFGYFALSLPVLGVALLELIVGVALIAVGANRWSEGGDEGSARAPPAPVDEPSPAEEERHFGAHFFLSPGFTFDARFGRLYAMAAFSPIMPIASRGDLWSFALGAGPSFQLRGRWRVELVPHFTPLFGGSYFSPTFGLAVGLHYTTAEGTTVGFTIPLFGGAVRDSPKYGVAGDYYTAAFTSLPLFSIGRRF
jgi:hypothetical protein